ncbi:histone-lysine N-methyltransferase SUVR5 [Actinidia rufa]|uniref:Histone-lysine N-methyltransferase SUVR5 n=1 Tax=Actinidia rufa TaxID=165716 RepID=A0A7J0H6F2_9ERIC|nr:histone-lysine N-methyltransferase SUVR5 [Actinidia rufa]
MEVLPFSGVHYVGESDCPDQSSGAGFMYDGESNCLEHGEQVQAADVEVNNLVSKDKGPEKERQREAECTVDELPNSDGHYNGASYFELDTEAQNFSCDSHDSVIENLNEQDFCDEPCLASETSDLIWRGKWQAGIRCARADWPLSTVKAKPTHDRKKYLVIFFPRTRNYSWADVLLVRPISEYPDPIAYRTYKLGVKMVKDLTLARRYIMQKLAVGMLNIIDQLLTKALLETARNMMVWKEFVMEASRCKGYSDLGRMLLKLQSELSLLISVQSGGSFHSWVQQCQNANSAESVEMLREELVDSILWDEVNLLSDVALQPELVSEWKNWKQEAMKWFSTSHPLPSGGDMVQQTNESPLTTGLQNSRKRAKLEVRRAESHSFQVGTQGSHQAMTMAIDVGCFDGQGIGQTSTLECEPPRVELLSEGAAINDSPGRVADTWGEIVVESGNSGLIQTKDVDTTPVNGGMVRKSLDTGNKSRQCSAFIEAKGRQCVRWASDGDVYCCVHLASRFVGNAAKAEVTPPGTAPMCEGTTTLGTKCKHRSLFGSSFCKKHRPHDQMTSTLFDNKLKRKHEEIANRSETTNCIDTVLVGEGETPLQIDPISVIGREASNERSLIEMPWHSRKEYDGTEVLHCIGSSPQDGSNSCLESPKKHSLIVTLGSKKLHLHHACELFYRLFKSIQSLRNPVPKEIQLHWAISEASKDVNVGEFLMKLVCREIEMLRTLWGFNSDKDTEVSSYVKESVLVPVPTDSEHDIQNTIKCKICSEKFLDYTALGAHWMDNHKKEAQWLFRGYVCAICLDSFTNKKFLESHVQERHHVQFVEQCMLYQCIACGGCFGNPEQLWLHVLSLHPANLKMSDVAQQHDMSTCEDSVQKLELGNSASVDNKNLDSQGALRRFICRFCGLKFDLLPDLGRHHQAAHMGPNSVGHCPPKRGIRFYAYRLKSGRLTQPRFRKGLGSVSYRIRSRASASMKRRIQASNAVSNGEMKVQSHENEAGRLRRLAESQCSAVAKILFSEIQKTKPRPSNLDILSIARSSCCKVRLQVSLEEKYGLLPERLYLKAAKLCSEHNILVEWHKEGFVCPKGCKPMSNHHMVSSLMTLSEDVAALRSELPADPVNHEWQIDECHFVIDSWHFKQNSLQKTFILCDDLSFGLESVPIMCVVDENLLDSLHIVQSSSDGEITGSSMPWESFKYVTKPLLAQSLCPETESLQLRCACTHSTCSPETCDHVYLFDIDYDSAKDIYGKPMHGKFPYDEKGRIILEEGYLVYECNYSCSCSRSCQNRVLQNGVQVKLEVFKTEKKGWAVRTREAILRGTFVCEYIGEVIDEQEANKRHNSYGGEGLGYFYDIDAHINDKSRLIEGQVPYVIDAMNYGNVSRYISTTGEGVVGIAYYHVISLV